MLKILATWGEKPRLKYRYLDLRREPEQYAICLCLEGLPRRP